MSATETSVDESTSTSASEIEEISDFEQEVDDFDETVYSRSGGSTSYATARNDNTEGLSAPKPYNDEPIADEEWVEKYKERSKTEKVHAIALQHRLENIIPLADWCKCNNCGLDMLQNPYEVQCCQEIEKCVLSLNSDYVLEDVEMPPSCITDHPGFKSNCLEKWTLRLVALNYKKKDHRKYRQSRGENALGQLWIPLPSCVYQAIRKTFGSEKTFTGYIDNSSDTD